MTLNVYDPIHLPQALVVAGREVVRRSRVDKAAKLFTFVRFHAYKHAPRAGDEHVPRVENTTSNCSALPLVGSHAQRESASWAETEVTRRA